MPGPCTILRSHPNQTPRLCARWRAMAAPIRPAGSNAANPPRAGPRVDLIERIKRCQTQLYRTVESSS
jgi:hypothetical protein